MRPIPDAPFLTATLRHLFHCNGYKDVLELQRKEKFIDFDFEQFQIGLKSAALEKNKIAVFHLMGQIKELGIKHGDRFFFKLTVIFFFLNFFLRIKR